MTSRLDTLKRSITLPWDDGVCLSCIRCPWRWSGPALCWETGAQKVQSASVGVTRGLRSDSVHDGVGSPKASADRAADWHRTSRRGATLKFIRRSYHASSKPVRESINICEPHVTWSVVGCQTYSRDKVNIYCSCCAHECVGAVSILTQSPSKSTMVFIR